MKKVHGIACLSLVLLSYCYPAVAQEDTALLDELKACRGLADVNERVACYDKIGTTPAAAVDPAPASPAPPPAPAATATAAAAAAAAGGEEVSEDFGLPKSEDAFDSIRANVVRCGKSNNRKFYFYLDNGQAWKYLGSRNLRYKNCDTPATIREDRLGYTLQMDGEPRLRVQRAR